jgi:hypothetical protein
MGLLVFGLDVGLVSATTRTTIRELPQSRLGQNATGDVH